MSDETRKLSGILSSTAKKIIFIPGKLSCFVLKIHTVLPFYMYGGVQGDRKPYAGKCRRKGNRQKPCKRMSGCCNLYKNYIMTASIHQSLCDRKFKLKKSKLVQLIWGAL